MRTSRRRLAKGPVTLYVDYKPIYPKWWDTVDMDDPDDSRVDEILDTPSPMQLLEKEVSRRYPEVEVVYDSHPDNLAYPDREFVAVLVDPRLEAEVTAFIQKVLKRLNVTDVKITPEW